MLTTFAASDRFDGCSGLLCLVETSCCFGTGVPMFRWRLNVAVRLCGFFFLPFLFLPLSSPPVSKFLEPPCVCSRLFPRLPPGCCLCPARDLNPRTRRQKAQRRRGRGEPERDEVVLYTTMKGQRRTPRAACGSVVVKWRLDALTVRHHVDRPCHVLHISGLRYVIRS